MSGGIQRAFALALAAATGVLAGCEARIEQLTTAPPGAVVRVDVDDETVVLSRGAAVAIACTEQGSPCDQLRADAVDGDVAFARRAWHDDLQPDGVDGQAARAAVVIAGLAEGETTVRLTWIDGEKDLRVIVQGR